MKRGFGFALVVCGCVAAARGSAEQPAPGPHLPTPYSAEQIRDVWQPGFRVEMRTTGASGESVQRMTVLAASAEGCTVRSEVVAASGEASAAPQEFTARWEELRDHALFPAAQATRERAECRSRLGAMPGWRYATRDANGAALTMCFADATPGPPVEHETQREGKRLSRTEHTSYGRPSGAEEKR